jgi:hypothetical protein
MNKYLIISCLLIAFSCKKAENNPPDNRPIGNFVPFRKGNVWGLADAASKKIVVEPQYEYIEIGAYPNEKEVFAVFQKGKWGAISAEGKEVLPIKYWFVEIAKNCILVHDTPEDRVGVYSLEGKELLPIQYKRVYHLDILHPDKEHLLLLQNQDDKTGIYNLKTKTIVLEPQYEMDSYSVSNTESAIFSLKNQGKIALFNLEGKQITPFQYTGLGGGNIVSGGYATIQNEEGLWGVVDKNGKITVPCQYKALGTTVNSERIPFQNEKGKWGYLDVTNGKIIVEAQYDKARDFSDGFGEVQRGKKVGFVDKTGKLVVPLEYDAALNVQKGICFMMKDKFWTPIRLATHSPLNQEKYAGGNFDFRYDYAVVTCPSENVLSQGVIDVNGKTLIPCQNAEFGFSFEAQMAILRISEQSYKLFKLPSGKEFAASDTPPILEKDFVVVSKNQKFTVMDYEGKKLAEIQAQSVGSIKNMLRVSDEIEGISEIEPFDATGNPLAAPPIEERYVPKKDKLKGYMDKNGYQFWKD